VTKLYPNAEAALDGLLFDGMTICAGGFRPCGIPERLIDAIQASGVKGLTIASNNAGIDARASASCSARASVKKMISSYVGENKEFERQYLAGELEVEFCPRARWPSACARAAPAFPASTPRPASARSWPRARNSRSSTARPMSSSAASRRSVDRQGLEGRRGGNLVFRKTARNFNQPAATASYHTVAEVEEIVPVGSLDPDCIHVPGIYIKRLVLGAPYEKKIEFSTVRARETA
jgi:3-oxoacid CoA-transferase subunit A